MAPSGSTGEARPARRSRRLNPLALVALAAVVGLLLAGCGLTGNGASGGASGSPPAGWHDVTPPASGTLVSYAVSPDVPGLIVACIGSFGHVSAAPPGPATLWRTRDGGATWHQLDASGLLAGCRVTFPAGGHGLLFALNDFGAAPFIRVSPDAGDSWRTLSLASTGEDGGIQAEWDQLVASVMRDGLLYAPGVATGAGDNGASMSLFSVSADDGQTWKAVEAAPDPLLRQGYTVQAIAADYRQPGAWFRLIAPSYGAGSGPATLEHSGDGGATWTPTSTVGPVGSYYGQGRATLVTTPAQPGRLCAGMNPDTDIAQPDTSPSPDAGLAAPAHGGVLAGPPYLPPRAVALYGSDDGGQHWRGSVVVGHDRVNGRSVSPGVAVDAHGGCYLAGTSSPRGGQGEDQFTATVWRLVPGATTPEVVVALARVGMETFAVAPGGAGGLSERLVAEVLTISHSDTRSESCGTGCVSIAYPVPDTPHLDWTAAP